jgi:hypothetical protein
MDMIERDLVPEYIDLADSAIEEARLLSQTIPDPLCAWQVYLAHLGLTGFDSWVESHLEDAGLSLKYDRSLARLLPSSVPDRPSVVTQLQLGEFRLCLIAVTESDEVVEIPAVAIEHPDQAGHFYVAVTVNTEAQVASFKGFVRHDQVGAAIDGVYPVAMEAMEWDGDRLFFLAMGLDGGAIVLPQRVRAMEPIRQMVIQPVLSGAEWSRRKFAQLVRELDNLAEMIVPTVPQVATAFRSTAEIDCGGSSSAFLEQVRQDFAKQGRSFPVEVADCRNVSCVQVILAAWPLPREEQESDRPEWSYFIAATPMQPIAQPVEIVIRHGDDVIASIQVTDMGVYQYMEAIKHEDEEFLVTLSNGLEKSVFAL